MAGKMERAFTAYRIKTAGVGQAEKLEFAGNAFQRLFLSQADEFGDNLPGGAAGGAAQDFEFLDAIVFNLGAELRNAELFAVSAQTFEATKAAAGERSDGSQCFFAGGNNGNFFGLADGNQVIKQVGMFKKGDNQVGAEVARDKLLGFVNQFREGFNDIDNPGNFYLLAIIANALDFSLA